MKLLTPHELVTPTKENHSLHTLLATGTAEVGGWTTRELLSILDGLAGLDVVGVDVGKHSTVKSYLVYADYYQWKLHDLK